MPPPLHFDHCSFEGNEFQVNVNYNNCNFGAHGHHSGTSRPSTDIPSDESGQADDGATPPHNQGNPSPCAGSEVSNQTQQVPNGSIAGLRDLQGSGGTNQDPQSPPPPYEESISDPFFAAAFQFANPRAETPSSLNVEQGSSLSSINSASDSDTDPKQERSGQEEREPERQEEEDGDENGEEEEEEEDEGEDATAGDEKWETESKEKEGDSRPRELEDEQLSIDQNEGSSAAMSAAGPLLSTGLGLTGGQQTGDRPMSLRNHSASSAVHRPETESISPSSASSRLIMSPAVSPAGQVQEEDAQARLTAGLLGDLPIDDRPDTAARDEIDPEMMAMLGRLRAEDIPGNGMGESEEEAAVDPPEQATGPSNGDACPLQPCPHPPIMLQVSPEEPIEGDTVDFELLNVPLHGIGDVEWKHNGRPVRQAFGLHHTINSVSQTDAGVYQCIVYREQKKINIVAVVEVTLRVKKSTDVTGQPCVEEEGGSGGDPVREEQRPADKYGDSSMQTDAPLPGSECNGPSDQSTPGGGDSAADTSVLGATAGYPDYESLQQRYQLGQRLMKEHNDLSYYPFSHGLLPADQRDCVVMNAGPGETTMPLDPMLEKLTATTEGLVIMTPKKTSPPNRTAAVALSIERKDSAQFMKDGSNGQSVSGGGVGSGETRMDRSGANGSSDRSREQPCGRGSSCPPGQKQKDARCPDRSLIQPKKLDVPAQPDINPIYYKIPLSELMDDADLLDEVKVKLDQDCCGRKNWKNLGSKFGIPRDQLENFAFHRRCTEAVLERVSSESPETSVGDLMNILYQIKRGDVVDVIKQNFGM